MTIWFDLTNSYCSWKQGIVGIVRAEIELARNIKSINKDVKFFIYDNKSFSELKLIDLPWITADEAYTKLYLQHQKDTSGKIPPLKKLIRAFRRLKVRLRRRKQPGYFKHPFLNGDVVFSAGWMASGKELAFQKVRQNGINFRLCYLVYDLVLSKFPQYYSPYNVPFEEYCVWIARNCDAIFYGGHTAKKDMEEFLSRHKINAPKGYVLKFGANVAAPIIGDIDAVLKKYGIKKRFFLTVGSFDSKKNYKTLYRAYRILNSNQPKLLPDMVIVGGQFAERDLVETILQDPKIKDFFKIIRPSDSELNLLYQHALAFFLPTIYEGWSLTLPEALNFNKVCICSDVPPLREFGEDIATFLPYNDPNRWAEEISHLNSLSKQEISFLESVVKKKYKPIKWAETAKTLNKHLIRIHSDFEDQDTLYYDISLIHRAAVHNMPVSGILRTQLLLARELCRENKKYNLEFVSLENGYIQSFSVSDLNNILSSCQIDSALSLDAKAIRESRRKTIIKKNAIFLSAGIGFSDKQVKLLDDFKICYSGQIVQVLYDLTPIITPQTHQEETIKNFMKFINFIQNKVDFILFGGQTCKNDYINYVRNNGLKQVNGDFIMFGSNPHKGSDESILDILNIKPNEYVLTVGSVEPRKNHEILYDAYTYLIENNVVDLPILVIAGYPGWKNTDFLNKLHNDQRVANLIKIVTPSDYQLSALYKNCKFTLLPSLYEGWSLTLPESLRYGKFALVSDVPPLRETGSEYVEYINPFDTAGWAHKIHYYSTHSDELFEKEKNIKLNYKCTSWSDCAKRILEII